MNKFEIYEGLHSDNQAAYDKAVIEMMNQMDTYIYWFIKKHCPSVKKDIEDLHSECKVAILSKKEDFDPYKGEMSTFFEPYLKKTCQKFVAKAFYRQNPYFAKNIQKVHEAEMLLKQEGLDCTVENLCKKSGLSPKQVRDAQKNARLTTEEEDTLLELDNKDEQVRRGILSPEERMQKFEDTEFCKYLLGSVSKKQKECFLVMYVKYDKTISSAMVGRELGMKASEVDAEIKKGMDAIKHSKNNNFHLRDWINIREGEAVAV